MFGLFRETCLSSPSDLIFIQKVGQARRKAILERQDVTLKKLQDELEKKVAGGDSVSSNVTDQILQQHYNQVTNLNEKIQVSSWLPFLFFTIC